MCQRAAPHLNKHTHTHTQTSMTGLCARFDTHEMNLWRRVRVRTNTHNFCVTFSNTQNCTFPHVRARALAHTPRRFCYVNRAVRAKAARDFCRAQPLSSAPQHVHRAQPRAGARTHGRGHRDLFGNTFRPHGPHTWRFCQPTAGATILFWVCVLCVCRRAHTLA